MEILLDYIPMLSGTVNFTAGSPAVAWQIFQIKAGMNSEQII